MGRTSVAILLVIVVGLPMASASDLEATRASGDQGAASASGSIVEVRPSRTFTLDISLGEGELTLVDEFYPQSVHFMGGQTGVISSTPERNEVHKDAADSFAFASKPADPDAILVIVPLAADSLTSNASTSKSFLVEPVPAQVIESSHSTNRDLVLNSPFIYYEYAVAEGLAWRSGQSTSLGVVGDFEVYLWGVFFTLTGPEGTIEVQTGYHAEPRDDVPFASPTMDDHYRYARMVVRGGSLDLAVDEGAVSIYAPHIVMASSSVTFQGADGTVPGNDGTFSAEGAVTATEGAYRMSYKPGGMDIDVTRAPTTTSGPYVRFTPNPWYQASWAMPTLAASVVAVGLTASAYSYPTLSGLRHLRYIENLTGDPRERGWRKTRAEGYALMAARAEDTGHMRRAVLFMALALRLDPHDPTKRLDLGIFQAARGKTRSALRHFTAAHAGLLGAGDQDGMAHNAYEAARAAAMVGTPELAIDWLRIAIQADASLSERAGLDPAFATVREHDDYAALTRA